MNRKKSEKTTPRFILEVKLVFTIEQDSKLRYLKNCERSFSFHLQLRLKISRQGQFTQIQGTRNDRNFRAMCSVYISSGTSVTEYWYC